MCNYLDLFARPKSEFVAVHMEFGVCSSFVSSMPCAFASAQTALYLPLSYLGPRRSAFPRYSATLSWGQCVNKKNSLLYSISIYLHHRYTSTNCGAQRLALYRSVTIDIFVAYLTARSVHQHVWRWIKEWLVNNEVGKIQKKMVDVQWRYYPTFSRTDKVKPWIFSIWIVSVSAAVRTDDLFSAGQKR